MARNKDFFINNATKRDKSFFVKDNDTKTTTSNTISTDAKKSDIVVSKDKYNSTFAMPVKQDFGDKVANFFKNTLPKAVENTVDNIKEPFTGPSASKLMTEAKISPQMMVDDAKIQLAKENPTREDYAMVKQTQEVINKYGKPESNFRAISEDTTKLQEQLKSAEKTWQVSPVDATLANTGAGAANIFGSLGSFANSLGADKVPLLKDVTNFAVDGARKAQENAQQYNRGNYGEALGTVTQGVVNLVPYFVLGTGKTAVKGATAVTKYAKYIEPIIKNPSFWYSLTSMWGSKYQEKIDEGYNRFQALGNSILYAVPAALVEVSGGIGAKGKEAQSLLRTMGEEIGEEIAQDIMGGISDKIATNHDLPVFSTTEDAIINPKELGKTALYTAPIVAIGGGANRVINNIANPNSQTEALPEMDVSTQNQLANITKNIEYQKQNEALANSQIEQIIKEARNNMEKSKTTLALPEGGKFYADEKGNVMPQNYVTPREPTQNGYSPVNAKQVIIGFQNGLQSGSNQRTNTTLPTQAEMVQKGNMGQITRIPNLPTQKSQETLQSAKLSGMTDMDIKKATDLNNMLRSGANLRFYDANNIPQNVQADKAKIANGFYRDGTLWINKNSKNAVEQILGHELTHHLESTNSYTDLSNTILDSEVFYDFIAEKGYANLAEYKTKLKEMGYSDAQMNNEMVARFVEEKLFTDQSSIDRLARQNTKLVEKIKNWISDLVVSFKGTSQEKELRRIENMYRKALDQARNTTTSTETQYSIAGTKAMENINDSELTNAYNRAMQMSQNNVDNETIRKNTGWFQDRNGDWKFEFTDKDMKIKDDIQIIRDRTYNLDYLLEHDVLFTAYPQLRNCKVEFTKLRDGVDGNYISLTNTIQIDPDKVSSKADVEGIIIHELQHVIQKIEGFERGASSKKSKLAYYTSLGEIEAADTRRRLEMERKGKLDRREVAPESSKANPKHEGLDDYLSNRTEKDIEKDNKFLERKANKGIKNFFDLGGGTNEEYMGVQNNELSTHQTEQTTGLAGDVRRLAGKEPAFSMPEIPKGYTRLYRGLTEEFDKNYDKKKLDNSNGYESWTDSYELAKAYGDNVYYIDIPTNEIKNDIIDDDSTSETYGDRNLIYFNDKPVGIKGKSGKEYMLYTDHDNYSDIEYKKVTENPDIRYSVNPVKKEGKDETRMLSRYAQTLQNKHEDIPEQINLIQKEVDNGNFTHEVIHDKRSLNYAQKYIEENGFEDAVNHWNELIKRGKPVDKDELALGQMIYNVAVDNKDTKLVMKMASDLVQEYTEIGRNLQSATLLRKMTPDGRLYALERSVQKINQDLMQKFDNFENIQIPEELADELLRSETQKDMDVAVEKIQEYIASKIPATWQEKLNSWRYLAMLGNLRTHIRNIVGNAVFIPAVEMKNKLAQVGEKFIPQEQRTKATLGKEDAKLVRYAENDFDKNQEIIRGENKYDIKSGIQEKRTIYSNGVIEAARKGNFKLLEAEDTLFLKYRYKKAFAGALKARGITIEQLRENSPETVRKVNEIRTYAINEAQKATYRDASILASMINGGKKKLLNAASQSTGFKKIGFNTGYLIAEGVMPFTKTPINIVKRGIEYSPAGLLNGVKNAIFDVKSGKVTAAQAIDKIAAGTTGTAIAALGLWLASMGLVSGGEEEKDKEQTLKQLKGYQDYSLNVLGKSYTIDWTAPSSIPLFIGVELYNSITSEDESAYLNALSNITEPVVEMSMLQGINDTLTTMGEDDAIGNIVGKTLMNYLGQYNPTLLGQIARSFDPVRRTTYVDKNIPVPAAAQRFIQEQAAKIPGVSRILPTYKDQFGQEQLTDGVINRIVQNFASPGYVKDIKEGTVEQGLTELYEKTGETSVIPSYASKTLTQNGKKINLTSKQYDTYAKTRGELSKKGLEGLFKDNYYKNLTDEQKVKIVEAIYDYANNVAKTKVLDDFELEFNDKKIQKLQSEGLDFYKYILLKKTADSDGNDYTSNDELDKAIKKYGLTRWQKTIKEKNTKNTKTTNTLPTLKQQRAKLPTPKK